MGAQSETLMIRRAVSNDPIADHNPHPDKALIKIATLGDRPYLVLKFSFRKNLAYGCIIRRPCFCSMGTNRALALCPVRRFWPLIRDRVSSGRPLLLTVTRRNINRIIKDVIGNLAAHRSERYSSHALRPGSAQELKETGSPREVVASAGRRRPASLLSYVDTSADVETDMSNLLANPLLSESEDELD